MGTKITEAPAPPMCAKIRAEFGTVKCGEPGCFHCYPEQRAAWKAAVLAEVAPDAPAVAQLADELEREAYRLTGWSPGGVVWRSLARMAYQHFAETAR